MKYLCYEYNDNLEIGILESDKETIKRLDVPGDVLAEGLMHLVDLSAQAKPAPAPTSETRNLSAVRVRAPFPRPRRNVFCVGKNYFDHAHEFSNSGFDSSAAQGTIPKVPIIFTKVPESVSDPDSPIPIYSDVSTAIDYEAELTVIIGKGGRGISKGDALDHVWGYTLINDVTARDMQSEHSQWLIGKSQDGFCPMGPVVITPDELDFGKASIRSRVNGEVRQNAPLSQLIFDVPTLIETLSRGITLYPGDVLATGTPAGVGIGFKPPKYLQDGDVVEVELDEIGVLRNTAAYQN